MILLNRQHVEVLIVIGSVLSLGKRIQTKQGTYVCMYMRRVPSTACRVDPTQTAEGYQSLSATYIFYLKAYYIHINHRKD